MVVGSVRIVFVFLEERSRVERGWGVCRVFIVRGKMMYGDRYR